MSNEKYYKMVWKATSANPGMIEGTLYTEDQIPDSSNINEVLGPDREFVEVKPGTNFYQLFISHNDPVNPDLLNVDVGSARYNWEIEDVTFSYYPEPTWEQVIVQRNQMLSASDTMFNFDTPDPLKTEWLEYRQLLRDLPEREKAKGNTPATVYWHDYVPPWPHTARIGVPDEHTVKAAWYKGENTYPASALPGSPECIARDETFAALMDQKSNMRVGPQLSAQPAVAAPETGDDIRIAPPVPDAKATDPASE
jgi:Phage tail assembly chaperone protein